MKRRLPGRGATTREASGVLPALAGRVAKPPKRRGPMSREEIQSRYRALVGGSPDPKPPEDPYTPTIYEGEDDE